MIDRVVSGPGLFYRRSEPSDGVARCGGPGHQFIEMAVVSVEGCVSGEADG